MEQDNAKILNEICTGFAERHKNAEQPSRARIYKFVRLKLILNKHKHN